MSAWFWLHSLDRRAQSALPRLPTENWGLQVRPHVVDFTGDGSGCLGGFTGHTTNKSQHSFGRLHWTKWIATEGLATGAMWVDDCIPNRARGTFHASTATVHVYRPRAGVFTRMTVKLKRHSFTVRAVHNGGWYCA